MSTVTNMRHTRTKPVNSELLTATVVDKRQLSTSFMRVTVAGESLEKFEFLGYDQWCRLFLAVDDEVVTRLPQKLDLLNYYTKFLAISKDRRPVLRNYTIRDYRASGPHGPEVDIDFVIHGDVAAGTSGPASKWSQTCETGEPVAFIDEGIAFDRNAAADGLVLVADESAQPAVAGILQSLPDDAKGIAVVEVPHLDDRLEMARPAAFEVQWLVRDQIPGGLEKVPGALAAEFCRQVPVPEGGFAWVAGETQFVKELRRLWVNSGVPKNRISFTGYWKMGKSH